MPWPSSSLLGWREVSGGGRAPAAALGIPGAGRHTGPGIILARLSFTAWNSAAKIARELMLDFLQTCQTGIKTSVLSLFCSSTDGKTKERWHQPVTAAPGLVLGCELCAQVGLHHWSGSAKTKSRSLIQSLLLGLSWALNWASKGNLNCNCSSGIKLSLNGDISLLGFRLGWALWKWKPISTDSWDLVTSPVTY